MKVLVIGGSGFLGEAIVNELLSRGDDVTVADRSVSKIKNVNHVMVDITQVEEVRKAVKNIEEVYHIAGMLGTSELNGNIKIATEVNTIGAINVFEESIKAGVRSVFYPGKPNVWLNTYSITKKASEDFAELYNQMSDTKFIRLRWFNAYGPKQHMYPVRKIIPIFCLLARFNKQLNVFGTGNNVVDMIHSRDIARWSVEVTKTRINDSIYDLGRGIPISVNQVAQDVNMIANSSAGVRHVKMRDGEIENTTLVADIQPLALKLGITKLKFEDWYSTLEETYKYYFNIPQDEAKQVLEFHKLF